MRDLVELARRMSSVVVAEEAPGFIQDLKAFIRSHEFLVLPENYNEVAGKLSRLVRRHLFSIHSYEDCNEWQERLIRILRDEEETEPNKGRRLTQRLRRRGR